MFSLRSGDIYGGGQVDDPTGWQDSGPMSTQPPCHHPLKPSGRVRTACVCVVVCARGCCVCVVRVCAWVLWLADLRVAAYGGREGFGRASQHHHRVQRLQ